MLSHRRLLLLCSLSVVIGVLTVLLIFAPGNSQVSQAIPAQASVHALIVPHHDVILDLFSSFYESVPEQDRSQVTRVYLFSPNHYHPEDTSIVTKGTNQELQAIGVTQNDARFVSEHGVNLHLPYIARYFPHAVVTPLLFTRHISQQELDTLASYLQNDTAKNATFFISSTDFSHYLPYSEAQVKDKQTIDLIRTGNASEILRLSDDYLDCPDCIYLVKKLRAGSTPNLIFHGNSAQYLNLSADAPTTSYFVLTW